MVNVEFLIVTYLVALFVDWVFQWDWQATNKSKWDEKDYKLLSGIALFTHSLMYATITMLIVVPIVGLNVQQAAIMVITLLVSHAIIDSRIPVKAIMKFKGMTDTQINNHRDYGFMHIGIDHRLHELVIFVLSMIIK